MSPGEKNRSRLACAAAGKRTSYRARRMGTKEAQPEAGECGAKPADLRHRGRTGLVDLRGRSRDCRRLDEQSCDCGSSLATEVISKIAIAFLRRTRCCRTISCYSCSNRGRFAAIRTIIVLARFPPGSTTTHAQDPEKLVNNGAQGRN